MEDIRRMQTGQVVDFIISYNDRRRESEKESGKKDEKKKKRKASQKDINAFFG